MSNAIETLESRTLFSADPVAALATDMTALKAELKTAAVTAKADATAVKVATAQLPKTAANKKLLATLKRDQTAAASNLATAGKKVAAMALAAAKNKAFITAYLGYEIDPTNAVAAAKLAAGLQTLRTLLSTSGTAVVTAAATGQLTVTTDLGAVSAANPTDAKFVAAAVKVNTDASVITAAVEAKLIGINADLSAAITSLGGGNA